MQNLWDSYGTVKTPFDRKTTFAIKILILVFSTFFTTHEGLISSLDMKQNKQDFQISDRTNKKWSEKVPFESEHR